MAVCRLVASRIANLRPDPVPPFLLAGTWVLVFLASAVLLLGR